MKKRPYLSNIMIINNEKYISIRASISSRKNFSELTNLPTLFSPKSPSESFNLLKARKFTLKCKFIDIDQKLIHQEILETDPLGNILESISLNRIEGNVYSIKIYEVSYTNGVEYFLGAFFPQNVSYRFSKIVISDFDKTLVDTKYSTIKEVYNSLTKPMEKFPPVNSSIDLLKNYIDNGYTPFILSASPHFYVDAIRDWLNQNSIFTAGILLKDIRQMYSFEHGLLNFKDLKNQGAYKLNQLIEVLSMVGPPKELVLVGDGFESDSIIYLTLATLLQEDYDPWAIWNAFKQHENFRLNFKQNSIILNKIYNLASMVKNTPIEERTKVSIHIRTKDTPTAIRPIDNSLDYLRDKKELVNYFC